MNAVKPTLQEEFAAVLKFCPDDKLGIDIGCGTNPLRENILKLDVYPHACADMVLDCAKLPFMDNRLDFVFSSHCLEDFEPAIIKDVVTEWLRVIKAGGYLVLLLPDMQGGRYAKAGQPNGNPSHKVDVGVEYMKNLVKDLPVEIVQCDTIDHARYFTFDFVIKKLI